MAKKPPKPKFKTPIGVAVYPYLDKPDEYKGKKNYRVRLRLPAADAKPLVDKIDELMEAIRKDEKVVAAKKKRKAEQKANPKKNLPDIPEHTPYKNVLNDNDEDTGEVEFDFKALAEGVYGEGHKKAGQTWRRSVDLFDAKGKKFKGAVWSGSRIRVSYTIDSYFINTQVGYGVKLYLEAAKIIELVQGGSNRSADEYGFGEEEEGFESDSMTSDESGDDASGDDASEGSEGDDETEF
jgi:hypothetical protein